MAVFEDPPLAQAVREFTSVHDDERYALAMRRLIEVAPSNARVSWITRPANLRKLIARYKELGLSSSTERREMPAVSSLIREQLGEARQREVFSQIKLRSPADGRTRWLSTEEIVRVKEAAGGWWIVIGLAIATGARRGEIFNLRVSDVDVEAGTLIVEKGKSTRARRVLPLVGEMLELVSRWIEEEGLGPHERLFPDLNRSTLRHAWDRIRERAGVEDVRFHDTWHTFAVACAKSGMPLGELQQRLGHASIATTMIYAAYAPPIASAHYQLALERLGMSTEPAHEATAD